MLLRSNPRAQPRGRDVVSTILDDYEGDTNARFSPIDEASEDWLNDNTLKDGEFLRPPAVDRIALYSPSSGSEIGFVSGEDESADDHNTYRQAPTLAMRKKEREPLTGKWEAREQQQQQDVEELREAQERLTGGKLGDKPFQRRVDSKNVVKDLSRPISPLSFTSPGGPASNIKQSLTRSSKPAELKLHKSNGSTAESIRSTSSSTTPPPPPPKHHRANGSTEISHRTSNSSTPPLPPPPPPKNPNHHRSNSVTSTHSLKRKPLKHGVHEASKSLPQVPTSPTKSLWEKHLPPRPIEIDEVTAADLAVKHPAVAQQHPQRTSSRPKVQQTPTNLDVARTTSSQEEQSPRATPSRRKFLQPPTTSNFGQGSSQEEQPLRATSSQRQFSTPKASKLDSSSQDEMKKFFKKITSKESEDEQVRDKEVPPMPKERSFESPVDLARERYLPEGMTPEEQGGPVIGGTNVSTRDTYNVPKDAYNTKGPPPKELQDAFTKPPTVINSPVIPSISSRSLLSKSPKSSEGDDFGDAQETLSRTFSGSTHTTITPSTLIQQVGKPTTPAGLDLPATHSTSSDSTVTAVTTAFGNAVSKLKTAPPQSEPEPKAVASPGDDSLAFLTSVMQSAVLLPAGAKPPIDVSSLAALASSAYAGPVQVTCYVQSVEHLVVPRESGQAQVAKSQVECHGGHGKWYGPRSNVMHHVLCQLCLSETDAIFQCKFCAMVVCGGCRGKVDEVMGRPSSAGGVDGAGRGRGRGRLAPGGDK